MTRVMSADSSKLAYVLTAVMDALVELIAKLDKRLDGTVDRNTSHQQQVATGPVLEFNVEVVATIAKAAVYSIMDERTTSTASISEAFQMGALATVRMITNNTSNPTSKTIRTHRKEILWASAMS